MKKNSESPGLRSAAETRTIVREDSRALRAKKIPGLSRGSWNKLFGLLAASQCDPESDGQGEDRNDPRMNVKGYGVDWFHGCHHAHSDKPNPDERTS